jgi:hypothetical protein
MEHNAAKELSSPEPLSCTPFFIFVSILIHQVPQHRRAIPALGGLPGLWLKSTLHRQNSHLFFFKDWRSTVNARQGLLKFSRLRCSTWLANTKRSVNKRRSYLGFVKLPLIWILFVHERKRKTKMTQLPPLHLSQAMRRATSNRQRDERCQ